jgi:hypothetical protein
VSWFNNPSLYPIRFAALAFLVYVPMFQKATPHRRRTTPHNFFDATLRTI